MLGDASNAMEPRVEFYGLKVPSAATVSISPQLEDEEGCSVSVHITQVALGAKRGTGPQIVFAVTDDSEFAIGTLEAGRCEQFNVDYMSTTDVCFKVKGSADVYLTGYRHISPIMDTIGGIPGYSSDEDDDLDDEEPVPTLKPLTAKQLAGPGGRLQNGKVGLAGFPGLKEHTFSDEEDDDDEDDDDEEDDDEDSEGLMDGLIDDEVDEGDDEDDDGLAADEDDLDTNLPPVTKAPLAAKRAAADVIEAAAKGKKPKVTATTVVAAVESAAAAAGADPAATPSAVYAKLLKDYIAANGATRLSDLGGKVTRPSGATIKLKKCLDESGLFVIDAKQTVSLKP